MRNALRAEGDRLAALGEPLAVNRGVEHAFATLDSELEAGSAAAGPGAGAAPDGWSYDRISTATGLSNGRVAQLARDPR